MNEIQIIQKQLATERLHFAEVTHLCSAALDNGQFKPGSEFAGACADYFAFALTRLDGGNPTSLAVPAAQANQDRWREFLPAFSNRAMKHFAVVDELLTRNIPVTEWRARSRIDADSIFTERTRYARVKATVS
jgi:hypothetical protein